MTKGTDYYKGMAATELNISYHHGMLAEAYDLCSTIGTLLSQGSDGESVMRAIHLSLTLKDALARELQKLDGAYFTEQDVHQESRNGEVQCSSGSDQDVFGRMPFVRGGSNHSRWDSEVPRPWHRTVGGIK